MIDPENVTAVPMEHVPGHGAVVRLGPPTPRWWLSGQPDVIPVDPHHNLPPRPAAPPALNQAA